MAKQINSLISLKKILEAEDEEIKKKNNDEEVVDENDDEEKVEESDDEDKVKESDDEEKVEESDDDWLDEDEDEDKKKTDESDVPGEQTDIDGLKKTESDEEGEKKEEDEDEDDDLLIDESEDEDDDEKNESDEDEEKVDEAAIKRLSESLSLDEDAFKKFKGVLSSVVVEHSKRISERAEKHIRKKIVSEANDRIRLAISVRKNLVEEAHRTYKAKAKRIVENFKAKNKARFEQMEQYDEMLVLFKSLSGVMEGFGLAFNPDAKKVYSESRSAIKHVKLENRKLSVENSELRTQIESMKISESIGILTKTMTESEKLEFRSLIGSLKVESNEEFLEQATRVRDRLFSKTEDGYDKYVEGFTRNRDLIKDEKIMNEEDKPKRISKLPPTALNSITEAAIEVLSGR